MSETKFDVGDACIHEAEGCSVYVVEVRQYAGGDPRYKVRQNRHQAKQKSVSWTAWLSDKDLTRLR